MKCQYSIWALEPVQCPSASIVIQGTLPDGKSLVSELGGKQVKFAFCGAPVEPRWSLMNVVNYKWKISETERRVEVQNA